MKGEFLIVSCTLTEQHYWESGLCAEGHDWVIVRNNPVNLADPWGLEPWERFANREDAARDFGEYSRERYGNEVEHGGIIRYDGMYYYDGNISHGTARNVIIDYKIKGNESAVVHTHTVHSWPSFDDVMGALFSQLDWYVHLPNGELFLIPYRDGGPTCW